MSRSSKGEKLPSLFDMGLSAQSDPKAKLFILTGIRDNPKLILQNILSLEGIHSLQVDTQA